MLESRFGTYDRKLLEWVLPVVENYEGANCDQELGGRIRKILAMSDSGIAEAGQAIKAKESGALSVKKYRLPYTEMRLNELEMFDEGSQALIVDIVNRLSLFNEEVDEARFYFRLTYTPGVSPENHELASQSVRVCYRNLAQMGRIIVDQKSKLIPKIEASV